MKQTSFASLEYAGKKRKTRREKFLDEMQQVVPWTALIALIEPHYPSSGRVGRPPVGVLAPRRFVWNPTVRIAGRRRARWACGQAAFEPAHMPMGWLPGAQN